MKLAHDHIHIRCQDVEASLKYWTDVMGGEFVSQGDAKGMPIFRVQLGDTLIALSPKREEMSVEPLSGEHRWGIWQLGYKVDDVAAAIDELKAKGAEVSPEPVQLRPDLKAAFIQAPDGVEIELLEFS